MRHFIVRSSLIAGAFICSWGGYSSVVGCDIHFTIFYLGVVYIVSAKLSPSVLGLASTYQIPVLVYLSDSWWGPRWSPSKFTYSHVWIYNWVYPSATSPIVSAVQYVVEVLFRKRLGGDVYLLFNEQFMLPESFFSSSILPAFTLHFVHWLKRACMRVAWIAEVTQLGAKLPNWSCRDVYCNACCSKVGMHMHLKDFPDV